MEQTSHSSRRLLLVGLAAVVGLILVIAVAAFVLVGTTKKAAPKTAASQQPVHVATKADVNQSLSNLNSTIKQASADQAAAKAAIAAGENQVQVAN